MFDFLNLLDLVFAGVVAFTDVQLHVAETVYFPPMGQVVPITFQPGTARWNKTFNCRYSGLVVPFERDWTEETRRDDNKTIRPAEPGKLAGYAYIVNKLKCPDQEPQFVFNYGERWRDTPAGKPLIQTAPVDSYALRPQPELQPKWLPQVLKTVERAAETNPNAKEFLDFSRAAEAAAIAAKEKKAAGPVEALKENQAIAAH